MDNSASNVKVTSPPQPIVLSNGKDSLTVLVSPPTIADIGAIVSKTLTYRGPDTPLSRLVNDPCYAKLPVQAQVEAAKEVAKLQGQDNKPVSAAQLLEAMTKPPVLAFIIWLLGRRNDSTLKMDAITPLVTEENADQVFIELSEAAQMVDQLGNLRGLFG